MKQQCSVTFVYLSWAIVVTGIFFLVSTDRYQFAIMWVILIPLIQWLYIRYFPSISAFMGYGRLDDRPVQALARVSRRVTLYSALGCPFCPVVKRRLLELKDKMGFDLEEVDITLKPGLLVSKGIRAVPVVEVDGRRIVGHATSEQLSVLISGA